MLAVNVKIRHLPLDKPKRLGYNVFNMTYEQYYFAHKAELDLKVSEIKEKASFITNEINRNKYFQEEMRQLKNEFINGFNK